LTTTVNHMKTTVEIPDALFKQARRYIDAHNMTMKTLIEQGLRKAMLEEKETPEFSLRDASFHGGKGLTAEFKNADWNQIRDTIYEGRG
jgi:hypothetical protein